MISFKRSNAKQLRKVGHVICIEQIRKQAHCGKNFSPICLTLKPVFPHAASRDFPFEIGNQGHSRKSINKREPMST